MKACTRTRKRLVLPRLITWRPRAVRTGQPAVAMCQITIFWQRTVLSMYSDYTAIASQLVRMVDYGHR